MIDPARRAHAAQPDKGKRVVNPRSRSMPRPSGNRTDASSVRLNEPSSGQPKPRSARPNKVSPSSPSSVASHVAAPIGLKNLAMGTRSEEHTSELQSLMRISYAVFCLKKQHQALHYTHCTH